MVSAVAAVALAGCMRVPPAPVNLPARAAARSSAALDWAGLRRETERLVPGHVVVEGRLDRVSLFAALLTTDPRIAEARAALTVAERAASAARKVGAPALSLTAEYANDPAATSPWALGAALALPLDLAGQRGARLARADLAVLAARYALAETVWSERMALNRALIEWQAAAAQVAIEANLAQLRGRQVAVLESRARQGEIAGLDIAPYRAQRAQAARQFDEARGRGARAFATIAGTFGLPAEALAGVAVSWDDFARPQPMRDLDRDDQVRAVAARSDVLQALVAYDQAEADLRGEVARQYPAITLGPGYTWERGLVKLPFALGLALPSWDLNHRAIAAAEARRAQSGAAIETALANAQQAIDAARAEMYTASAALARIRASELPEARLAAERAERQLKLGSIGRSEWVAQQIALGEAQRGELEALVRLRNAEAGLEEAVRRPLQGPETAISAQDREVRP